MLQWFDASLYAQNKLGFLQLLLRHLPRAKKRRKKKFEWSPLLSSSSPSKGAANPEKEVGDGREKGGRRRGEKAAISRHQRQREGGRGKKVILVATKARREKERKNCMEVGRRVGTAAKEGKGRKGRGRRVSVS